VFAIAAPGFTTKGRLSSFHSLEHLTVRLSAAPFGLAKRIFCHDGENRQFSQIHHGWVCSTEAAPWVAQS